MNDLVIVFLFIGLLGAIVKPLTTMVHELGHAIPALLLTRKPVTIYLGSYGDEAGSYRLCSGRLSIWINRNPLRLFYGCCRSFQSMLTLQARMVILLGGTLATLLVGLIAVVIVFAIDDSHGALRLLAVAFLFSALFDLYHNLRPNPRGYDVQGEVVYNDGRQLQELWRTYPVLSKAVALYRAGKFKEVISLLQNHTAFHANRQWMCLHWYSLTFDQQYSAALEGYNAYAERYDTTIEDCGVLGSIHYGLGNNDRCLYYLQLALEAMPQNPELLNNLGYYLTCMQQYQDAIPYLDKAIAHSATMAFAWNNRGLARIKTGNIQEGLQDIEHSLRLDPRNAYAYRNKGIYCLEQQQHAEAKLYFEKAAAIDSNAPMLQALLQQVS